MDGVSITQPGPPVRNASASSMQCRQPEPAPAKAVGGGYQRHDLVAGVGSAWPIAQGEVLLYQFGKAEMLGRVASRINPALATKRRSSKATWMRSGWLRGSIYWVLLVWGCFSVSKTINAVPPARACPREKAVGGGYQRHDLVAGVGSAWPIAQGEVLLYQFGKAEMLGRVASRINPALATKRRSSKATWMRSGWLRGSIYWVLLVWGCFSVSKTIIPDAQGHFLTPSARRYTHLFGGLGIRNRPDHR